MSKAYLGVGTNIGDCVENLKNVITALDLLPLTKVTQISKIYKTTPVGYDDQDDFLNMVVEVDTELTAENLLGACLGIEAGLGRVRTIKNGPRIVDIDLLLYEEQTFNSKTLILPHPRMFEREFVLRPLLDINFDNSFVDREKIFDSLTGDGIELLLEKL
jgi:2-amino-4-hydroxy-6-hydroxymethyldihydropteridine diphosphokinase